MWILMILGISAVVLFAIWFLKVSWSCYCFERARTEFEAEIRDISLPDSQAQVLLESALEYNPTYFPDGVEKLKESGRNAMAKHYEENCVDILLCFVRD